MGRLPGARHYKNGLYRPTANSIMRTLGKEFNSIGRDSMVKAFKAKISPLNNPAPPANWRPADKGHVLDN